MNSYKLVKAEDGIVWVSVQPLVNDIYENLTMLENIEVTDDMQQVDQDILNHKILGMKSLLSFLAALINEQNLTDLKEHYDANTDRQTEH